MFTGLVEEVGRLRAIAPNGADARLVIEARRVRDGLAVGDSVAIDGCCLTVTGLEPGAFAVTAVPETLRRTTLGGWSSGRRVNLERALVAGSRVGGHLVQGHVDGVGRVAAVAAEGAGRRVTFAIPAALARFVAEKGSLAIDGVSLTVATCAAPGCTIAYIPHTLAVTVAGAYAVGHEVNLEVDLVARYVARWLETGGREDAT